MLLLLRTGRFRTGIIEPGTRTWIHFLVPARFHQICNVLIDLLGVTMTVRQVYSRTVYFALGIALLNDPRRSFFVTTRERILDGAAHAWASA
jgi:hypothetical protein